jgi:hypothetical protein
MSLALTPQGSVFAGTMGNAVWRIALAGKIWNKVANGMPPTNDHGAGLAIIPGEPGTVFVGTLGNGVSRTSDGGRHWTSISGGLPAERNATLVLSVAYASAQDALYAGTADGVYELAPIGPSASGSSVQTMSAAGLTARVRVEPNRSGPNQLTVSLQDRQGRPVQQARVFVLTTHLEMVMGTGLVALHQTAPGSFTGTGDLGMGGRWRLQLLVYRSSGLTRMTINVRVGA